MSRLAKIEKSELISPPSCFFLFPFICIVIGLSKPGSSGLMLSICGYQSVVTVVGQAVKKREAGF